MGGAGGGGWRGRGWVVEKAPCSSHDPPSRPRVRPCPPLLSPTPPCPPLLPLLPGWLPASRGGRPRGPEGSFWDQKPLLGPKRFWAPKMHFGAKKRKMEQKVGKNEKREPKTPKKPLSRARLAEGCRNDPKKGPKAQKSALLRPTPLFGAKVAFGGKSAKRAKKCDKGENGLQNTKETIV